MIHRFRGTLLALAALIALLGVAALIELRPASVPDRAVPDPIFRFEKEDLVGFVIERPGERLAIRNEGGTWTVEGRPWRPNRSMIRRVAHQLHDLDARADVVADTSDPRRYGFGEDATRVEVSLADRRKLGFEVGDPNPTSVSWYMRVTSDGDPNGRIYVVKKSAMDLWRLDAEAFREDRIATFDADEAVRIVATVDGRTVDVERTGEGRYRQRAPVDQPASRDAVRTMLGRISGMRAMGYVADHPTDLARWQLDPPLHRIVVTLDSGETISLRLGAGVPGADPPQRWALLEEDDAVYAIKDGLLDSFRLSDDALRDRELVGRHEWDLETLGVQRGGESVALRRTSDGWRWPDDQAVPGSTPKRVAGRAAELRAVTFPAGPPALDPVWATVELGFPDGATTRIDLGARSETEQLARVDGGSVAEVDASLAEAIEDLFREYTRKQDRDADKRLDGASAPQ